MRERLEEIKEKYNYERLEEFIDTKPIIPYELKWLIKQAEKVEYWRKQHRKRANELEDAYFKIQLIENQLRQAQVKAERYKQALKEIDDDMEHLLHYGFEGNDHLWRARKVIEQALEGK